MSKATTAIVAALSLLGASTAASAQSPASKLSIAGAARAGAKAGKKNEAVSTGVIIGVLVAAAVIAGIVIIADDDSSSN